MEGEAYVDIVWKQFRKHRLASRMIWAIAVMFLLAIFAPLIASNQPFWFREQGELRFPWVVALLNPETAVDYFFNAALVAFFPWAALTALLEVRGRRSGVPGRRRAGRAALLFLALLAATAGAAIFVRPSNRYFTRDFKEDQHRGAGSGAYTLIAYGPLEQDLDMIFKPPLSRREAAAARHRDHDLHLLGTDDAGRDVFVRLLYGTRISMTIGVVAVSLYVSIGIAVGALAGYFGGRIDILISRVVEIVLLFPTFFLILTLVALVGPSIYIIMVVIGVTGWPTIARLIRGEFLRQRSIDYVAAARGLGAGNFRVMFRHVLPNALGPAFVAIPFGISGAVVTEAGLSVLGFGVRPPAPSWGSILNLAVNNYHHWWFTVFAGLSIFFTVWTFNLVGNGLRDAMDPRLKGTQ
jgi:peptide/nickel transport system permease protein